MLSIDLKELEGFKVFEMVGDIEPLLTKKRIWTTLKYSFEAYEKDDSIIIPVQDSVESTHKNLLQVLEKHSLISNTKHDLDLELDLFRQEEESFKIHSEKARGIWWTDFESSELTDFVENLKTDLPNRRLTEKQLLASFHLAFSKCSCNFSVPGAGKTSTVYGAYSYLKKNTFTKSSKKINKIIDEQK